jgi:hypothetical protein
VDFQKRLKRGYKVSIKAGTKQITLLRNLLAGVLYEPGGAGIEDFLVIYELLNTAQNKVDKDESFRKKYGEWLITVHNTLTDWKPSVFPFKPRSVHRDVQALKPYLPSKQAYFGWKLNPVRAQSASIRLRNPLLPGPRPTEPRRVGVGYRDKGSRRDPAEDASPSWQEVAAANSLEERLLILRVLKDRPNFDEAAALLGVELATEAYRLQILRE